MRVDAGVVISASHNRYSDNGIKIFATDGFKLADAVEAEIEQLMADESLLGPRKTGATIGRAEKLEDSRGAMWPKNTPRPPGRDPVVVDDHGAAYRVALLTGWARRCRHASSPDG
jgi:phosphoglucosamine mutase